MSTPVQIYLLGVLVGAAFCLADREEEWQDWLLLTVLWPITVGICVIMYIGRFIIP